ncbi:hypothetical protein CSA37_04800 [Candidatus Fermentibacteria bacterium]|nr:MAG: hypothetical protein CSA37_04800 [Candidatus Fermentibacteria bacterium]
MKRVLIAAVLFLSFGCRQESLGPLNGILVVHSKTLTDFIDHGGLESLHMVIETVDPEQVFSFSYAELSEFTGTLQERRIILMLVDSAHSGIVPGSLEELEEGILFGEDVWALNQQVFAVCLEPGDSLPEVLPDMLVEAYNSQMASYVYRSFVSTSMTSEERVDSLRQIGFTMDVPKSYLTHSWRPEDGFVQFQRQPDDESLLLFSLSVIRSRAELNSENAMLAREAMARTFFFDAAADSVDRARTNAVPFSAGSIQGLELTGVWRNPEYLNAGSFTTRVLDAGDEWYIMDMEVYNPGHAKEPYLREGWIIMDTFRKE